MYQHLSRVGNISWRALLLPCRQLQVARRFRAPPLLRKEILMGQPIGTLKHKTDRSVSSTALPKGSDLTNSDMASENPNAAASEILYSPISAGQIRAVTLHRGDSSNPLRCSLNEVALEDPP